MTTIESFITSLAVATFAMLITAAAWWNIDSRIVIAAYALMILFGTLVLRVSSIEREPKRKGYIGKDVIIHACNRK